MNLCFKFARFGIKFGLPSEQGLSRSDLVKVADDVVEEPQTLDVLMDQFLLLVEVRELGQRGEQNPDPLVRLGVQLLASKHSSRLVHPATGTD